MLYEEDTGHPVDKTYLECDLPPFLDESLRAMVASCKKIDSGERDSSWSDHYYCLYSDINVAEVDGHISSEQAWHLRRKYLRLEKE